MYTPRWGVVVTTTWARSRFIYATVAISPTGLKATIEGKSYWIKKPGNHTRSGSNIGKRKVSIRIMHELPAQKAWQIFNNTRNEKRKNPGKFNKSIEYQ